MTGCFPGTGVLGAGEGHEEVFEWLGREERKLGVN